MEEFKIMLDGFIETLQTKLDPGTYIANPEHADWARKGLLALVGFTLVYNAPALFGVVLSLVTSTSGLILIALSCAFVFYVVNIFPNRDG